MTGFGKLQDKLLSLTQTILSYPRLPDKGTLCLIENANRLIKKKKKKEEVKRTWQIKLTRKGTGARQEKGSRLIATISFDKTTTGSAICDLIEIAGGRGLFLCVSRFLPDRLTDRPECLWFFPLSSNWHGLGTLMFAENRLFFQH